MKKPYISPSIIIEEFDVEDVITASAAGGDTPATNPGSDFDEFSVPGDVFVITYD